MELSIWAGPVAECELLNAMMRNDSELITADTEIYLRDCSDHVVQSKGDSEGSARRRSLLPAGSYRACHRAARPLSTDK